MLKTLNFYWEGAVQDIQLEPIRKIIDEAIEKEYVPGAALHVSHRGEVVLQEVFGNKIVSPRKKAMTIDTIFDVASLTKVVATLPIVLAAIDDGHINLRSKVAEIIPEFGNFGKQAITVKHLLTHTSGLESDHPNKFQGFNLSDIKRYVFQSKLSTPVGSKVVYSDLGMIVLYFMLDFILEDGFETYLFTRILRPLGMTDTQFNPQQPIKRFAATEYSARLSGYKRGVVHDEKAEAMGGVSGHAGLFTTVEDLGTFARMIEKNGPIWGKKLLSNQIIAYSRKNHTYLDPLGRGLGWEIKGEGTSATAGELFSNRSYGHTGFTGTSIWFDPDQELHIILLTNRVHLGRDKNIQPLRTQVHNAIYRQLIMK